MESFREREREREAHQKASLKIHITALCCFADGLAEGLPGRAGVLLRCQVSRSEQLQSQKPKALPFHLLQIIFIFLFFLFRHCLFRLLPPDVGILSLFPFSALFQSCWKILWQLSVMDVVFSIICNCSPIRDLQIFSLSSPRSLKCLKTSRSSDNTVPPIRYQARNTQWISYPKTGRKKLSDNICEKIK